MITLALGLQFGGSGAQRDQTRAASVSSSPTVAAVPVSSTSAPSNQPSEAVQAAALPHYSDVLGPGVHSGATTEASVVGVSSDGRTLTIANIQSLAFDGQGNMKLEGARLTVVNPITAEGRTYAPGSKLTYDAAGRLVQVADFK